MHTNRLAFSGFSNLNSREKECNLLSLSEVSIMIQSMSGAGREGGDRQTGLGTLNTREERKNEEVVN